MINLQNLPKKIWKELNNNNNLIFLIGINIAAFTSSYILSIGYKVCVSSGIIGAIIVFIICCIILYAASLSMMKVSISSKVDSHKIIVKYLGPKGASLCTLITSITFLGWFLWHLKFGVEFLKNQVASQLPFLNSMSAENLGTCLGLLFCITVLKDFGLRIIGIILVPISFIFMCSLALFLNYEQIPSGESNIIFNTISFKDLSLLLGTLSALILTTPIFFRSVHSIKLVRKSLRIAYLIILPFFYILGALCGIFSENHNVITSIIHQTGLGPLFLSIYVLLGTWSVCSLNLYCGADVLAQSLSHKNRLPIIFFLGMFGSLFFSYSQRNFSFEYSNLLGCLVVGILGIIITKTVANNFELTDEGPQQQRGNYYALLTSYGVGILVLYDILTITGSLFFDMALTSCFTCLCFLKFPPKIPNINFSIIFKKKSTKDEK